jgi:uncharacterized protein (DUF2252 family)
MVASFFYPLNDYLSSMKRLMFLLVLAAFISCKDEKINYPKAENALDAGREFIDAFLKGDTKKAEAYMVDDSENKALLRKLHRQLKNRSDEDEQGYKESSIIMGDIENVTENEVVIQYKASYDRIPRKIKVINSNGTWLVDLKYTINPNL